MMSRRQSVFTALRKDHEEISEWVFFFLSLRLSVSMMFLQSSSTISWLFARNPVVMVGSLATVIFLGKRLPLAGFIYQNWPDIYFSFGEH
jgi:hypothetical protein